MYRIARLSLFALLLLPLQAQSRFGLELGSSHAQGDLRAALSHNGKVGATLGATLRLHSLSTGPSMLGEAGYLSARLRASVVAYPEHPKSSTGADVAGAALNLEIVGTFGKGLSGFQLISGFGTAQWERKSAANTSTTRRPVSTLGAGWQWRHCGVEARWSTSSFSEHQTANSIDAVFTYRF